jgi:PPOX class probable F420-dependent enzyme
MAKKIPAEFLDLFEKPAFAHLATIMEDGTPQVTPVWVDYDGQYILINSRVGRRKTDNMAERADVALDIIDPENPYRYLAIRGKVVEITAEGSKEHIDKVARRYIVTDVYPWGIPGEVRQIYKIEPYQVFGRVVVPKSDFIPR